MTELTDPTTADAAAAATPDDVAAARVGAWLDGHDPVLPKGAVRSLLWQRAELLGERARLADRNEQLRNAVTEAAGLLHRLSGPGPCDYDGDGACRGHDGFASGHLAPCPHPLGRRFVETWGAAQIENAEATQ